MRFLIASLLLANAAAGVAAPATGDFVVKRVSYADLDLSGSAGQAVLRYRLTSAAKEVCGVRNASSLTDRIVADNCRRAAMAAAERQLTVAIASADTHRTAGAALLASQ